MHKFQPGPHYAIFAWHQNDPNTGISDASYHTATQRFSKIVTFRPKIQPLIPSEDYANTIVVDENNPNQYLLLWKLINQDEIQFEAHVKQLNKILSILNIFYIKIGKNNWLDRLRVVLKYKTSKF